jgi:hypothetical protein
MNALPRTTCGEPAAVEYALAVPIEFTGGSGLTRRIIRQAVCFTTAAPLVRGQRLAGTLHLPGAGAGDDGTVRFAARVVGVERPPAEGLPAEVTARFEELEFAPSEALAQPDCPRA